MSTLTRPAWATETIGPDKGGDGVHRAVVTVGNVTIGINQVFDLEERTEPVLCDLNNVEGDEDWDAQGCRDLAAALLEAAKIIDDA